MSHASESRKLEVDHVTRYEALRAYGIARHAAGQPVRGAGPRQVTSSPIPSTTRSASIIPSPLRVSGTFFSLKEYEILEPCQRSS